MYTKRVKQISSTKVLCKLINVRFVRLQPILDGFILSSVQIYQPCYKRVILGIYKRDTGFIFAMGVRTRGVPLNSR